MIILIIKYYSRFYIFGGFGVPTCDFLSEHGSFVCDDSIQVNITCDSYIKNIF